METNYIALDQAVTLHGLFLARVRRTPDSPAYRYYDNQQATWRTLTWSAIAQEVARWKDALRQENLAPGDRVAVMLRNGPLWVAFEQAALALGLVVVPLYVDDRPENIAYIANDSQVKILLLDSADQWRELQAVTAQMAGVQRFLSLTRIAAAVDDRLQCVDDWLVEAATRSLEKSVEINDAHSDDRNALATIMYTSGTTGKPKGVMLSHHNILHNAFAGLQSFPVRTDDSMLSFLPLSHALERTAGYYMMMMAGGMVAYARSIALLSDDLQIIRPTILISVPRIYERVFNSIQANLETASTLKKRLFQAAVDIGWHRFEVQQRRAAWGPRLLLWPILKRLVADKLMARLGGRLRLSISGGAALPPKVSRVFLALGLPLVQGYGMTETSPVISVNHVDNNWPETVGVPLQDIAVRVGENNALLVKGPCTMLGYWNNPKATAEVLGQDGWLNTGDTASINAQGFVTITGRLKEIIVMSNGEKVPPVDIEAAILRDRLFEQVLLYGDGRSYLVALVVINTAHCHSWASRTRGPAQLPQSGVVQDADVEKEVLERIAAQLKEFPGYAKIRRATVMLEPWSVENGLQTPTLKLKRGRVVERFADDIAQLYAGH